MVRYCAALGGGGTKRFTPSVRLFPCPVLLAPQFTLKRSSRMTDETVLILKGQRSSLLISQKSTEFVTPNTITGSPRRFFSWLVD